MNETKETAIYSCAAVAVMAAAAVAVLAGFFKKRRRYRRDRGRRSCYRRCTSLATAYMVDRASLQETVGMTQNVVNAVLFFQIMNDDGGIPSRQDMVELMTILAQQFERMRSRPSFRATTTQTTCVWEPLPDVNDSIRRAVTEERPILLDKEQQQQQQQHPTTLIERETLRRVEHYKAQPLLGRDEEGKPMPHWRVVLLPPSAVLVRIDHCIGDGLSLVTLLQNVGSTTTNNKSTHDSSLHLSDLSPLFHRIQEMGDVRVRLAPCKLFWLPNLWRAVSLLVANLRAPLEPDNPLRPLREHLWKPIPVEHCGTVYFPTTRLSLWKELARHAGGNNHHHTTVNDIVLVCFAQAVTRYFDMVGNVNNVDTIRLLLPIANPIRPSWYGDEVEGLCNRMTPVAVPLRLGLSPRDSLDQIQQYLNVVKRSNAPLFLTVLNTLFNNLLTTRHLAEGGRNMFARISCVYSNVPGPTKEISLAGHAIARIQTVLPHPTSIFQVLSYNEKLFLNITLDTRSAPEPWRLRGCFLDALHNVASEFGVSSAFLRKEKLDACCREQSEEWGGNNVVYTLNE